MKKYTAADTKKLQLLPKIQEHELKSLITGYRQYLGKLRYLQFIIFGFLAVILIYNFFVAGKNYSMTDYETIKTMMVVICSVFVVGLLVLLVIFIIHLRNLKKKLFEIAAKHGLDKKSLKKEVDIFLKITLGGPGLR